MQFVRVQRSIAAAHGCAVHSGATCSHAVNRRAAYSCAMCNGAGCEHTAHRDATHGCVAHGGATRANAAHNREKGRQAGCGFAVHSDMAGSHALCSCSHAAHADAACVEVADSGIVYCAAAGVLVVT